VIEWVIFSRKMKSSSSVGRAGRRAAVLIVGDRRPWLVVSVAAPPSGAFRRAASAAGIIGLRG
jgi:hypothetical protein